MNEFFIDNWLAPRLLDPRAQRLLDARRHRERPAFAPATDVSEFESEFRFTVSLPGLDKKDIKVEVNDDQITISGSRNPRVDAGEQEGRSHLSEISFGTFSRTFTLPHAISEDGIVARFENGLLHLTVPKAATPRARVIEIM